MRAAVQMTLSTCLLSFSAALLVLCWAPLPEEALSSMPVLASASIAMRMASAAASNCCPISCIMHLSTSHLPIRSAKHKGPYILACCLMAQWAEGGASLALSGALEGW